MWKKAISACEVPIDVRKCAITCSIEGLGRVGNQVTASPGLGIDVIGVFFVLVREACERFHGRRRKRERFQNTREQRMLSARRGSMAYRRECTVHNRHNSITCMPSESEGDGMFSVNAQFRAGQSSSALPTFAYATPLPRPGRVRDDYQFRS
jgi:hypothetical protein